jgi:hypothetical protein
MLQKLQRKTLMPAQLMGYALALFVGVTLLLIIGQFYLDIKPIIKNDAQVFKSSTAVINKEVSLFKTMNKKKLYFSEKELKRIKKQVFIQDVAVFNYASFEIKAYTDGGGDVPAFYTDLFFESIPDNYIDVVDTAWHWQNKDSLIPIIIPESYLKLYNFGFAESQGLPVFSKNTIQDFVFNIKLIGKGKQGVFKGRIVGFSSTINSILVPNDFLQWANKQFGKTKQQQVSRVLLSFKDPSDERIVQYFNEHNYTINKEKLAFGKLTFFFKTAFAFVFVVALIIIVLAIAFVVLSINLMLQKNKEVLKNLYSIGFTQKKITRFYKLIFIGISTFVVVLAFSLSTFIRGVYLEKFNALFDFERVQSQLFLFALGLLVSVSVLFYFLLKKRIAKICI